jgi:hypothetical protein
MTLQKLIHSLFVKQFHLILAFYLLLSRLFVSFYKSRERTPKKIGYSRLLTMWLVSLSSFGINELRMLGPFSPNHILSIVTIFWTLARQMQMLHLFSLCLSGLFVILLEWRIIDILFANFPWLRFKFMVAVSILVGFWWNSTAPKFLHQ